MLTKRDPVLHVSGLLLLAKPGSVAGSVPSYVFWDEIAVLGRAVVMCVPQPAAVHVFEDFLFAKPGRVAGSIPPYVSCVEIDISRKGFEGRRKVFSGLHWFPAF